MVLLKIKIRVPTTKHIESTGILVNERAELAQMPYLHVALSRSSDQEFSAVRSDGSALFFGAFGTRYDDALVPSHCAEHRTRCTSVTCRARETRKRDTCTGGESSCECDGSDPSMFLCQSQWHRRNWVDDVDTI